MNIAIHFASNQDRTTSKTSNEPPPNVVVNSDFIVDSVACKFAIGPLTTGQCLIKPFIDWPILYCSLIERLSRMLCFSLTRPEKHISIHTSSPFSSTTTHPQSFFHPTTSVSLRHKTTLPSSTSEPNTNATNIRSST